MNNRLYTMPVKALAMVLLIVFTAASCAGAFVAALGYSAGFDVCGPETTIRQVQSAAAREQIGRLLDAQDAAAADFQQAQTPPEAAGQYAQTLAQTLAQHNLGSLRYTVEELDSAGEVQKTISGPDRQGSDTLLYDWVYACQDEQGAVQAQVRLSVYIAQTLAQGDLYARLARAVTWCAAIYPAAPYFCAGSLLAAIAMLAFLLCAAGRRYGQEGAKAGPLDRIWLELVLIADGFACAGGLALARALCWDMGRTLVRLTPYLLCGFLAAAGLLVLGAFTLTTIAVRVKTGTFLRSSAVGWCLFWVFRAVRGLWRLLVQAARAIPCAWKLGLGAAGVSLATLFSAMTWGYGSGAFYWLMLSAALLCGALIFGAHLNRLFEGGRRISQGHTEAKIDLRHLHGALRAHGETLNDIGESIDRAVAERMKSERLKTELITNVSHDIRTPLTSVINYLDLLAKNPDSQARGEYLKTAMRHAARLKKMTDDLIDASKAATGNIAVSLAPCAVEELLRQCLGEYEQRLISAQLTPVLTVPENCAVLADGQLLWRVLDNLLGNACKYAMPGTRLYLDAVLSEGRVTLSLKNISRVPLGVSADELMQRFVRGDSARTSEGSGLGLNIAKSLVELMGGQFALEVDGDLFKCAITLPAAVLWQMRARDAQAHPVSGYGGTRPDIQTPDDGAQAPAEAVPVQNGEPA
jgi:signal transduction histidine kinase